MADGGPVGTCRIVSGPVPQDAICNFVAARAAAPAVARIRRAEVLFGRGEGKTGLAPGLIRPAVQDFARRVVYPTPT